MYNVTHATKRTLSYRCSKPVRFLETDSDRKILISISLMKLGAYPCCAGGAECGWMSIGLVLAIRRCRCRCRRCVSGGGRSRDHRHLVLAAAPGTTSGDCQSRSGCSKSPQLDTDGGQPPIFQRGTGREPVAHLNRVVCDTFIPWRDIRGLFLRI